MHLKIKESEEMHLKNKESEKCISKIKNVRKCRMGGGGCSGDIMRDFIQILLLLQTLTK
jgi:hypothetical protein